MTAATPTRFLKAPSPPTTEVTDDLRQRVSDMLRDIENGGIDAVRRWSWEPDGWGTDSFIVGSLFMGDRATVAYGDKAVGANRVPPTSRAARYTGGLWVGKFLKTVTYQRLTAEGTRRVAPAVAAISTAEHFAGHALTATMRLDRLGRDAG